MSEAAGHCEVAFDLRVKFRNFANNPVGIDVSGAPVAPKGVVFSNKKAGDPRISLDGRLGSTEPHDRVVWAFLEHKLGSAKAVMDVSTRFLTDHAGFFEALAETHAVEISLNCEQTHTVDLPEDFLQVLGGLNQTIRFCFHADSEA